MKKYLKLYGILLILFVSLIYAEGKYVGSKNSNKYHYPTCRWALKIREKNKIEFNSIAEAKKAGYVPCKVCKPPVSD